MSEDIKIFKDEDFTEENILKVLNELDKKNPYRNPTENMSERMAIEFNKAMQEHVRKNY